MFNLYDKNTWQIDNKPIDPNVRVLNKIKGNIGNKLPMVRALYSKIQKLSFDNELNVEAKIADQLSEEAKAIMEIKTIASDDKYNSILNDIDDLEEMWGNQNTRDQNIEKMIDCLKRIEDFNDNFETIVKIEVIGNAAWKEYLKLALSLNDIKTFYFTHKCTVDEDRESYLDD